MKITTDLCEVVSVLKNGGIAVLKTDTIYGIVAASHMQSAVQRVYQAKNRDQAKACIILVSDYSQIFGNEKLLRHIKFNKPTSVIVPALNAPEWLTRGGDSLAYRKVSEGNIELLHILKAVGPLIAPSANPEGQKPAENIDEAVKYFGDKVDIYFDGGQVPSNVRPSQIIKILENGKHEVIRK